MSTAITAIEVTSAGALGWFLAQLRRRRHRHLWEITETQGDDYKRFITRKCQLCGTEEMKAIS